MVYTHTHTLIFLPSSGRENPDCGLFKTSLNTLESLAIPSQPVYTNVNIMSKVHT